MLRIPNINHNNTCRQGGELPNNLKGPRRKEEEGFALDNALVNSWISTKHVEEEKKVGK